MRFLWYSFLALFSLGMLSLVGVIGAAVYTISYYGKDLPDYSALKDYSPPVVSRIYAGDGGLLAEYAEEKRVFVPIESIPPLVKNAFISAEDQNFYSHEGVDLIAIARAIVTNLRQVGSGRRMVGASTITQQVAKNFLLTNEVSFKRKIKEAILAFRMEKALSKDELLELYLNEIYLGARSYGVAAAALSYFDKALEELSIEEAAYLAALPKAPNNYHPVRNHEAALARRNWVIGRMAEDRYIGYDDAFEAKKRPLEMAEGRGEDRTEASYFAEEVRRELKEKFGGDNLYGGGLAVRTSIDARLQAIARESLRDGLIDYDRRHGYRGPLANANEDIKWDDEKGWQDYLRSYDTPSGMRDNWRLGVVLKVTPEKAVFGMRDGKTGELEVQYLSWAREIVDKHKNKLGDLVTSARQVLKKGDVIMVVRTEADGRDVWGLRQIPEINGAIIAIDPHTGRVLAMQGGWDYDVSVYNRATQAERQPGSAFKPFVYLAALDKGFTPATLVLDAPFVIDQGPGLGKWRPANYSREYYGPTPIRIGIEKSRNLMTVRLADFVGMKTIREYARKFGVLDDMEPHLANALGAKETTLLKLVTGYSQLVNGGKRITPSLIDRIQDRRGKTIYRHDQRVCPDCGDRIAWEDQAVPEVEDTRVEIADPRKAYQIVSMLEGVVERGTGASIKNDIRYPLAGKTGTTNESRDAWFIGFSPDLAVGVFIGFDDPRPLGKKESGSSVAVPVFGSFMKEALKDTPPKPFRVPAGIKHVQINAKTGARAEAGDEEVIWEAFLTGTEPTDRMYILDGKGISLLPSLSDRSHDSATIGTGGLY
jgi:penicillin-binding protein 1A